MAAAVGKDRRVRSYSRLTVEALELLGQSIRLARKDRLMTEAELAKRVGISRTTLQQIEKGDPKVEIGLAFETAVIVGVDLFVPEVRTLAPQLARVADRLALLTQSVRRPKREVKDDF
jgi:DNA-binding XRE family transcriptional regulator